jgi:hypothetical protein
MHMYYKCMGERWLPVVGYEGKYLVSDQGRVKSLMTDKAKGGRVLKQRTYSRYRYAGLWMNGRLKQCRVHRLVLSAFVGPCPEGMEALHGEGGALDNRLANLRWGTRSENMREQVAAGNHNEARKTHCVNGHPFNDRNTYMRPDGKGRACRQCMLDRNREYRDVQNPRGLYHGKGTDYVS